MVENGSKYLSEVRPVAKEKKTLELMEKNIGHVVFGFEASFDEIADFYRQTYKQGELKVEMLQVSGIPYKFRIVMLAESTKEYSKWEFDGDLPVFIKSISEDGEIICSYSSNFIGDEEDLFHYFGLNILDDYWRILRVVKDIFNNEQEANATLNEAKPIIAEVQVSELSDFGIKVIESAKRRLALRNNSLFPKDGKITVNLWQDSGYYQSDMLGAGAVSKLSWARRAAKYGSSGLYQSTFSHMGNYGLPIPTKDHLNDMSCFLDRQINCPDFRMFTVSHKSAEAYVQGRITAAEVINKMGEEIQQFCSERQYRFS